ncbi:Ankyrin Repeat [Cymbomonas tetramitiformis]|uniref:anthranilate synthase n=1 Tax=Cymbomonas tetramitiformis TaxID=36881 RepID=A0AAE0GIN9_9CHLO|nr:Ankyrin Repeat [Cymbomonas tetramitiformis]
MNPSGILLGPGPGTPEDSGISLQTVKELGPDFPLFGVCMGHQCIGQVFGGSIVRAQSGVMHGKSSPVEHSDVGVLQGLPSPFTAARYHSLVIDHENFPDSELEILGRSDDGMVMAVKHVQYPHIQGVQFHPESCITPEGMQIMRNFLGMVERGVIKE